MFNKMNNEFSSWLILICILLVLIEVLFFNNGLIFSLVIAAGLIYYGRKRINHKRGRLLFWVGILFLAISVIGMITFRFLLLAIIIYFIFQYVQSKKHPNKVHPTIEEPIHPENNNNENVVIRKPLLKNTLFGEQKTVEHTYEWNDINIQTGIGDTIIDLSYTVLPEGETVIFIRNVIGNIKVYIPYDIEVSVNHSVMVGAVNIFDIHGEKMFNQNIHVETPEYEKQKQKIKIFTSLIVGDIEVRRI